MTKETRTVTVDPDVEEYLSKDNVNASGLVNDLVKEYMNGSDAEIVGLELQEQHKKREAAEAKERFERLQTELEEIRELKAAMDTEPDELEEALETLSDVPPDPTNPAIRNWADNLGMSPQQLTSKLEAREE